MTHTKIIDFKISDCPKCHGSHDFKLKVYTKENAAIPIILFGGPGEHSEIMFSCEKTNQIFTYTVPVPENTEIAGVATEDEIMKYGGVEVKSDHEKEELKEWIKTSRSTALDYCKTMLSSSVGAIPVYFVIIKYLGYETLADASRNIFLLPPLLFLLAALLFVLGLKPRFEIISEEEFPKFRKHRLKQLNNFLLAGTILFVLAIILAILVFFSAF